jgi:hypothetical protein
VAEGAAAGAEGAQQSLAGGCTAVAMMSAGPPRLPTRLPACLPLMTLHSRCTGAFLVVGLGAGLFELFQDARPFAAWRIGAACADGATVRTPAVAHLAALGQGRQR